jgi:NTP pyrophosphatase (non-canonical NTP hydrolase)
MADLTDVQGLDALAADIHQWARDKGFYDREFIGAAKDGIFTVPNGGHRNPSIESEKLLLVISEVCEAQSALRDGDYEHECEEIADAIIRLLDYANFRGFPLEQAITQKMLKNHGRPKLHGRKVF